MSLNHFESFLKPYLLTGHIQTFLVGAVSVILKLLKKYFNFFNFNYKREIFQLRDGAFIAIDHANKINQNLIQNSNTKLKTKINQNFSLQNSIKERDKILLLVPGIASSSEDFYIKSFIEDFIDEFDCKVINSRGLGGMKLYNEKTIGPDLFHDLFDYVLKLCTENEHKKIFVIGFSYGGYILTRMLSHYSLKIPSNFYAASGVCFPTSVDSVENTLDRYYGIYNRAIINTLKRNYLQNIESIFNPETCRKEILAKKEKLIRIISQVKTMRECSLHYIMEISGDYASMEEYYAEGDLQVHVPNVRKPFLAWFAEDDPLVDIEKIPFKEFKNNPNCITIVSEHGGHLGMLSGTLSLKGMLKEPIMNFFKLVDVMRNGQ